MSIMNCYVRNTYRNRVGSDLLLHHAPVKDPKSVSAKSIVDEPEAIRASINNVVSRSKEAAVESQAALQELRDQFVTVDVEGLGECIAAMKTSLLG